MNVIIQAVSEEKKASLYKKELWYEANKEVNSFLVIDERFLLKVPT